MKIALFDDDSNFFKIFQFEMDNLFPDIMIDYYSDENEFYKGIQQNQYQLIFLDIEIPNSSGFIICEKIKLLKRNVPIIYITNRSETVLDAFGTNVIGFIEKKRIHEQLEKNIHKAFLEINNTHKVCFELKNGELLSLLADEIIFCEIVGKNLFLYTTYKTKYQLSRNTITNIFDKISLPNFIFIHRSVFINISHVNYLGNEFLTLEGYQRKFYMSKYRKKDIEFLYLKSHIL